MRHLSLLRAACALLCVIVVTSACNKRLFQKAEKSCDQTLIVDRLPVEDRPADILIVVDNSGSMAEEQAELARNFVNDDTAADGTPLCPLQDLTNIPPQFKNPTRDLYTGDGPLAQCGFIQMLAAFDNDFRVGVITTDVGLADNRRGQGDALCASDPGAEGCAIDASTGDATWGLRLQRGCLHAAGASRDGDPLVLTRADLFSGDPARADLAGRFTRTLLNIRTFGSAIERGLDAVDIFLDPDAARAPGCEDDLRTFRRDDARLVVMFLTDEDDCSHGRGGAFDAAHDELADEPSDPAAPFTQQFLVKGELCYSELDTLSPIAGYAERIKSVDKDAKIAVIGGMIVDPSDDDGFAAAGCLVGAGQSEPDAACFASAGNSSNTTAPGICSNDPAKVAERGGLPCCVADPASRYLDLAHAFRNVAGAQPRHLLDSICKDSFRETMIRIAAFIAATNEVQLAEEPQDDLILVTVEHADGNGELMPRIDPAQCADGDGWFIDGTTITLCGDARVGPGERLSVRAKGAVDEEACR